MKRNLLIGLLLALPIMAAGCQRNDTVATNVATNSGCRSFTDLDLALRDPGSVCELNLSGQGLTETLPGEIRRMQNMKILNVSRNRMTSLPAEVGQLTSLQVLDVSQNRLTGLPLEIGNLSALKTFNVSGNAYSSQDLDAIAKKIPQAQIVR